MAFYNSTMPNSASPTRVVSKKISNKGSGRVPSRSPTRGQAPNSICKSRTGTVALCPVTFVGVGTGTDSLFPAPTGVPPKSKVSLGTGTFSFPGQNVCPPAIPNSGQATSRSPTRGQATSRSTNSGPGNVSFYSDSCLFRKPHPSEAQQSYWGPNSNNTSPASNSRR